MIVGHKILYRGKLLERIFAPVLIKIEQSIAELFSRSHENWQDRLTVSGVVDIVKVRLAVT